MIVIRGVPLYWGIEREAHDRSLISRSWLVEDLPPFRQSIAAFRIRVSHKHWLHLGFFRYNRDPLHSGLMFRPTEIGRWGRDQKESDASGEAVEPLLSDDDPGSGDGAGDESPGDGGTVSGVDAPRDRHEVAAHADDNGDRAGGPDPASSALPS